MDLTLTPLREADRARITAHLLRLSPDDRSLRFAAGLVTDSVVQAHAARMPLEVDLVLGLCGNDGRLVAMVQGCRFEARGRRCVEAAFSVDLAWRGASLGTRLMQAVLDQVERDGGGDVVCSCLVRNQPMRRIMNRAGMAVRREEDECLAELCIPDRPAVPGAAAAEARPAAC